MPTGYAKEYIEPETRIMTHIVKTDAGCWLYQHIVKSTGYGKINVRGKQMLAHRFSYELARGPIADGMTVDHLCRNRACVNPDHLEVVTRGENVLRGNAVSAIAKRATHCPHGHEYSLENTYVRVDGYRCCKACRNGRRINSVMLSDDQKAEVARLKKEIKERQEKIRAIVTFRPDPSYRSNLTKTHCKMGHALTSDNIIYRGCAKKEARCKTCQQERSAKSRNKRNREAGKKIYVTKRRVALTIEALLGSA